jgi:hypothetical protein
MLPVASFCSQTMLVVHFDQGAKTLPEATRPSNHKARFVDFSTLDDSLGTVPSNSLF